MSPTHEPAPAGAGVLVALRRHAFLVVACGLLVGAIAAALLSQRSAEYEATAQVLLPEPGPELAVLGATVPQSPDRERRVTTGVAVMKSGATVAAVADRLGDVPATDLRGATTVAPSGESDVVDVTATAPSASEAARRADTYARTAARRLRADQERRAGGLARDLRRRYDDMSRRQKRTGEGATLRDRQFALDAIADGRTGGAKVVQRAGQATARVDQPQQLIILGVLLGLLVGAGLALLRDRSDRRVRGGEDLAGSLDVPVLASVGRSRAIRRRAAFDDLQEQDAEVFRFLHGKLRFGSTGTPPRTVLVTSARDGEGKSSVATYLASAASAAGARVLLVEADLRRPVAAGWLGAGAQAGLVDVLRGDVPLPDALAEAPIGAIGVLDVLPAGAGGAGDAVLLQSEAMRDLLVQARSVYDLVVIDTSPLGLVADALPLLARVDGVLIAGFAGRSHGRDVRRLRWQITEMGGRVLGVVLNSGRTGVSYYDAAPERGVGAPA